MIEVRPAVASDADAICDAHVAGWRVGYRGVFQDEYLDSDGFESSRRERWRAWDWGDELGGAIFVPVVDGAVVGFSHVGPVRAEPTCDASGTAIVAAPTDVGEVYGFYLHPDAWGSGAAPVLMTESEDWLRRAGFTTSVLWVLRDNPRARAFYEKAGWSSTGKETSWSPPGGEAPVPEVQYGRPL